MNAIFQTVLQKRQIPNETHGVPLLDRKLRHSDCSKLLETLKNRIASWRNKLLSFAGRLELVKLVLFSLITHWILAFSLSSKTIAIFSSVISNFLWNGRNHGIKWDTLGKPKDEGGIGLRKLEKSAMLPSPKEYDGTHKQELSLESMGEV